jgi:hypothetical protein
MRNRIVLFLGILAALVISTAVTVPYVLTWSSCNSRVREMNFVNMPGETYVENMSKSLVNITLVAVYPKVAVHTTYHVFKAQLIFLVKLHPSITDFRIAHAQVIEFRSLDWSRRYVGWPPHDFQSNFYRNSEIGGITPYFVNATIEMTSGGTVSYPWWYLAGTIEVHPEARLNGFIILNNDNKNSSSIGFLFDMADYPTSVYFFNYSFTLWVAYGSSICIAILPWLVSYSLSQRHTK